MNHKNVPVSHAICVAAIEAFEVLGPLRVGLLDELGDHARCREARERLASPDVAEPGGGP